MKTAPDQDSGSLSVRPDQLLRLRHSFRVQIEPLTSPDIPTTGSVHDVTRGRTASPVTSQPSLHARREELNSRMTWRGRLTPFIPTDLSDRDGRSGRPDRDGRSGRHG